MAAPPGDPPGDREANGRGLIFFAQIDAYTDFCRGQRLAAECNGGAMSTQLEEAEQAGGSTHRAATLTPQASRLLEGPVLPTLLRLAAPTVALMLLQGVVAAGEAAFVGRLGSDALAGVSLSFPLVMLMTTLSAGAYGGGVASGVARRWVPAGTMTPRDSLGPPSGCPPSWDWPRLPPCCSSARPSTPRSGPPARPWKPQSSTPMSSSSGPSRPGCSTPPPVCCAGAATRRTRPPRAPPGAWSRWRPPRSSSSERARSPGSGSPGRPGPSSATTWQCQSCSCVPCGRPARRRVQPSVRSCRVGVTLLRSCA